MIFILLVYDYKIPHCKLVCLSINFGRSKMSVVVWPALPWLIALPRNDAFGRRSTFSVVTSSLFVSACGIRRGCLETGQIHHIFSCLPPTARKWACMTLFWASKKQNECNVYAAGNCMVRTHVAQWWVKQCQRVEFFSLFQRAKWECLAALDQILQSPHIYILSWDTEARLLTRVQDQVGWYLLPCWCASGEVKKEHCS